ncbi:MAG: acyltransferase [Blastocatellia bacterium]|nr:acyltransferase [Blastocatellia bacterium]MBL8194507.1 acyltransferase [Blastocatellia bacterium]MBN8724320.1 acyltransferase [Acidobacteriota bacterium]
MSYRSLQATETAETIFDDFLARLEEKINDASLDRNDVVRDTLYEMYFGQRANVKNLYNHKYPIAARAVMASFDPRNVTMEPEYYSDIDIDRYQSRKPLIWLWQMFDRSPLGGNLLLAFKFRRMLAPYIFHKVGKNFKCFHFVEWSFGYNLSIGDNVVIHRNVLLDDRGEIIIGNNVSISDYANLYSHSHSVIDIHDVSCKPTIIHDNVRLTYHSTVLAGITVGENGMVGAMGLATRDVKPYHVNVGIPAKSVLLKPNAPDTYRKTD